MSTYLKFFSFSLLQKYSDVFYLCLTKNFSQCGPIILPTHSFSSIVVMSDIPREKTKLLDYLKDTLVGKMLSRGEIDSGEAYTLAHKLTADHPHVQVFVLPLHFHIDPRRR